MKTIQVKAEELVAKFNGEKASNLNVDFLSSFEQWLILQLFEETEKRQQTINKVAEFEFTTTDLDSQITITDTCWITIPLDPTVEPNFEKIEKAIQEYVDTQHSITTLSGNTWQIDGFERTGAAKLVSKTRKADVIFERTEEFASKNYPLVNER